MPESASAIFITMRPVNDALRGWGVYTHASSHFHQVKGNLTKEAAEALAKKLNDMIAPRFFLRERREQEYDPFDVVDRQQGEGEVIARFWDKRKALGYIEWMENQS